MQIGQFCLGFFSWSIWTKSPEFIISLNALVNECLQSKSSLACEFSILAYEFTSYGWMSMSLRIQDLWKDGCNPICCYHTK